MSASIATAMGRATDPLWQRIARRLCGGVAVLAGLWLVLQIYRAGQPLWAMALLLLIGLTCTIFLSQRAIAYRYLFPGLAAMLVFVVGPLLYTAQIGFTNYSSSNLLSLQRATEYLLEQTNADDAHVMNFTLHAEGSGFRVLLSPLHEEEDENDPTKLAALRQASLVSPLLTLRSDMSLKASVTPLADVVLGPALPLMELLKHRRTLQQLHLTLPDASVLRYAGVREFGPLAPVWRRTDENTLVNIESGQAYRVNGVTGFYENAAGARLQPGFKVNVGLRNYRRMLTDPDFRAPFLKIFIWTVMLAALTVLTTGAIGVVLAVVLNWESLRFRTTYRTLLFLPYAVPAFISILVFKGLFNQNFGEINLLLNAAFGIKPAWFADPLLAQSMILIVNTWLGYPYIMVLCTGLIKAIPADLYEASAIAGAGPIANLFRITLPLIVKPLTPLLISVFAFNFNNFVLIALLTDGRPDFLNTKLPAGTTDILVSYTYRIAFRDAGQNFGLAAAISTVIFFMIAALSLANLKMAKLDQP